ncbi:transforming growth factor beta regulator 1 [Drosophila montana]|uniref:transforming growth factor beta regulator 1 n=1 Tax=Drosophila montana TaxID=40370 RepID=UPI00313F0489
MKADYKKTYRKLKWRVKNYLLENASIVDEVWLLQKELSAARSERLSLIERLMFYEGLEKAAIGQHQYLHESRDHTSKNVTQKQTVMIEKTTQNKFSDISTLRDKTFPLKLNNVLVHSIGEIVPANLNFHTSHWIYPVGYVATRIYAHPRDPRKKCVFTCKILNNAGVPQFQLIPDNDLDGVLFGETANKCHQELLNCIQGSTNESLQVEFKPKGEVFFGLSNQKVKSLIMSDVKIKQCTKFKGYMPNDSEMFENNDPTLSFAELQIYLRQ